MFEIQEVDEDKNYAGEGSRTWTWYFEGKHFREFKMEKRGCYGLVRTIIVLMSIQRHSYIFWSSTTVAEESVLSCSHRKHGAFLI